MITVDVRAFLLESLEGKMFTAQLTAGEPGILAGATLASGRASQIGLSVLTSASNGLSLQSGFCILRVKGSAEQIARGEEELLACVGKASGVATAAARFIGQARGRARIVCGAWKKVAPELRKELRDAILVGGAGIRLLDEPFIYLDKNFVRMFSGISEAVSRACSIKGRAVAVQLCGEKAQVLEDAWRAYRAGADVLMVDTGKVEDLRAVVEAAGRRRFRNSVKIAFGGGVTAERIEEVITAGAEIIDIGRSIIDAPLLDFRLDVEEPHESS
jgi:nicotinate-nucleotide pyrophosphorylase (carboxylating)